MKAREAASLLVFGVLAVVLCAPFATAGAALNLESDYVNKVLTLRRFYTGNHLSFGADGTLIGLEATGPWTLDGQLRVQRIELRGQSLDIQGRRLSLVFDKKGKPSRDVVELIDESESNPDERRKMEEPFLNRTVEIEIALGPGETIEAEIESAMDAVFVKPSESMAELVPDCWREYFEKSEGRAITVRNTTLAPLRESPGVVSPPRPVTTPEPEFSEDARRAKYQGTVLLSFIVDTSGQVLDVRITTPLGMGLDEKAVDAVRKWKFEPAKKDGEPVPVQIAVETDFHLY
jgi:TonB family protein